MAAAGSGDVASLASSQGCVVGSSNLGGGKAGFFKDESIEATDDAGFQRLRQVCVSLEYVIGRLNHLQHTVDHLTTAMLNLERIIIERGIPPPSPRPLPAPLFFSSPEDLQIHPPDGPGHLSPDGPPFVEQGARRRQSPV